MESLEKPELKRDVKWNTDPLPELRNAVFTIVSNDDRDKKMVVAYDIAGNAIETSINEILEKKYAPNPALIIPRPVSIDAEHFTITPKKKEEEKRTRSGVVYSV